MSALGAATGGVLGGQLWKVSTFALLGLLLAGGGASGALWWSAAAARDKALDDLTAAQAITAELRAGVDVQNRAITQWYEQAKAAEARGTAARQAAEANGLRYDQALQQLAGARATTCDEAMPYVNKMLEGVR
ncbi:MULTISPECIES: hypothetical protein [unclassified Duganella]|uniref:hypothetical protein n=1 Tax=unclassified Duganella TaxID=2636909 RepID=UPI000891CED5|nr:MULTISPECIES: hypothetical protein [unclassified Duganella]SDG85004.1 hypothetical protein SAMN05216320_107286 [Duganella sp. OV458]SDK12410.1 hypothetical protein SAMN05428973_108287 [Duganella sp. OV510]